MLVAAYIAVVAVVAIAVMIFGIGREVSRRRRTFPWMTPAIRRSL